jgi:hypothetical protein
MEFKIALSVERDQQCHRDCLHKVGQHGILRNGALYDLAGERGVHLSWIYQTWIGDAAQINCATDIGPLS